MKGPKQPPNLDRFLAGLSGDPHQLERVMMAPVGPTHKGRYLHWDKLRFLKPPGDLSSDEWWIATKTSRLRLLRDLPLLDAEGRPFRFCMPDAAQELAFEITRDAGGSIGISDQVTNPSTRDRYLVRSLIEEAITSSQLEGAAVTRPVAKEMIRTGRTPRDRGERMIMNNYLAMSHIRDHIAGPLAPQLIFDLHHLLTVDTLDDSHAAGRLRRPGERVEVATAYDEVLHTPPPADQLESRLEAMCDFANHQTPSFFVHPIARAIILHFWLAYDHPFVDGNGRTARALFYWSMLSQGFWLCEYISISQVIRKAYSQYERAFLYTETDENDLTYFVFYHLDVIRRAIEELHAYLDRKMAEVVQTESLLRQVEALNHRQTALLSHALRHPTARYMIASHQRSHNVAYQTARSDLLDMSRRGLLEQKKAGRTFHFSPPTDLEARLKQLG